LVVGRLAKLGGWCNDGKTPGLGLLAEVELRRALKLFSDLALIVLSVRLFRLGAIRLLKKFLRAGHWVDWTCSRFL